MSRYTWRVAHLLNAFEQGRRDAQKKVRAIDAPPYKDPERAEAWERGWRFQREVIERPQAVNGNRR
jgi:hypothetical protein